MAPDKAELVARIAQTRRRPVVATKSQGSAGASVTGPEASANGAGDEIAAIDVFVLRHRLARIRIYAVAAHWDRASVLVRATDRDGRAGWGETYLAPGVVATVRDVAAALIGRRPVAPRCGLGCGGGRSIRGPLRGCPLRMEACIAR